MASSFDFSTSGPGFLFFFLGHRQSGAQRLLFVGERLIGVFRAEYVGIG
jgi:hypothetical protein